MQYPHGSIGGALLATKMSDAFARRLRLLRDASGYTSQGPSNSITVSPTTSTAAVGYPLSIGAGSPYQALQGAIAQIIIIRGSPSDADWLRWKRA